MQVLHHDRSRRDAVGVRVADHKDLFPALYRALEPGDRPFHIGQQKGIVKELVVLIQKKLRLFRRVHPAPNQNFRNNPIDPAAGRYAVDLFFRARTFQHPAL